MKLEQKEKERIRKEQEGTAKYIEEQKAQHGSLWNAVVANATKH